MSRRPVRRATLLLLLRSACGGGFVSGDEPESPIPTEPHMLAAYLIRAGKYEKAIPIYQQLAASEPRNPDRLRELMWAYWQAGRLKETVNTAWTLLDLNPQDVETLNLLAKAHVALGDKAKALATYETSLAINAEQL